MTEKKAPFMDQDIIRITRKNVLPLVQHSELEMLLLH